MNTQEMIGRTLSHYRILEKLGSGGMGEVYLAEDTKLGRKVALKLLPPELAESEERRARFEREAKAVAALNHPNIVTLYSVEEAEGLHFLTMELVRGKPISQLVSKAGLPLARFFDIAIPLADAVAAAHQEGITHRDLKPDNVMVTDDGRVKVLDFGLAKSVRGFTGGASSELPTETKTVEGLIVGTLAYMSPEQAQGKAVDARTDVFSLGVVLYEMLTGRRPFAGETPAELLSSIIKESPAAIGGDVPRRLSRVVERCLAKNPLERYQSVIDLRHDLAEIREELQEVRAASPGKRSWKWLPAALIAIAAGAALITLVRRLPERAERGLPRFMNPVQITSATGVEDYPAWSPDGRLSPTPGPPGEKVATAISG
jgi:serine/threonine protein kinase